MALNSIFESSDSERRWKSEITKIFENEVKIEINNISVSIFRVPTTLSSFKPEAYAPQLVGLGPYHHFSAKLYEMERYKIVAASRVQKQFQSLEFKQLVDKLNELEFEIRASYHMYLDIEGDTLAWIMAIDSLFLLDFLNSYVNKKVSPSPSPTTAHLVDAAGKKLAHEEILGDIVMLENQIPIFLLSKILSIQSSLPDLGNNLLPPMLLGYCKALSPLKLKVDLPSSQVFQHSHLLDLLYHLIVPNLEESQQTIEGQQGGLSIDGKTSQDSKFSEDLANSKTVFTKLWGLLSKLNVGFVSKVTKPINVIIGLPWNYIGGLLGFSSVSSADKENTNPDNKNSGDKDKKTPVVEEIMIPSVSYLSDVGVIFSPTTGDITTIKFDQNNKTFYLPVITLNINSEVVMRNLVAYETSIESESLIFTRYTELMNGIIDTTDDAKLLREKKIIINSLKSDDDVVELFNGMSKSVRLTNVPYIDKAIKDVNKYFSNTRKVKVYKRVKAYVYGSWRILTLLAVILLILLMSLQSFCSVYSCNNIIVTTSS